MRDEEDSERTRCRTLSLSINVIGQPKQKMSCPIGQSEQQTACPIGQAEKQLTSPIGQSEQQVSCAIGQSQQQVSCAIGQSQQQVSCDLGPPEIEIAFPTDHTSKQLAHPIGQKEQQMTSFIGQPDTELASPIGQPEQQLASPIGPPEPEQNYPSEQQRQLPYNLHTQDVLQIRTNLDSEQSNFTCRTSEYLKQEITINSAQVEELDEPDFSSKFKSFKITKVRIIVDTMYRSSKIQKKSQKPLPVFITLLSHQEAGAHFAYGILAYVHFAYIICKLIQKICCIMGQIANF
jgi:hypothetical protein